jgi:hypothetical protein
MLHVALFASLTDVTVHPRVVRWESLASMLTTFHEHDRKEQGKLWSPTRYRDDACRRGNAGVVALGCVVFDVDGQPDWDTLAAYQYVAHTSFSHTAESPHWRVVVPLAREVEVACWRDTLRRARAALCPQADASCKDPSRAYYLPAMRPGAEHASHVHDGVVLDADTLPDLPEVQRSRVDRTSRRCAPPHAAAVQVGAGDAGDAVPRPCSGAHIAAAVESEVAKVF